MNRTNLGLLAGLSMAALALPAIAADAAATYTIDLMPLIQGVIAVAAAALSTLGAYAVNKLIAKLSAEKGLIDEAKAEKLRNFALQVIGGGVKYAEEMAYRYGRDRSTVQVRNEMVAIAAGYAIQHGKERLDQLGLSREAIERIIMREMETPPGTPQDALTPMRLPAPVNPGANYAPPPAGSLAAMPTAPIPPAPPPPAPAAPYNPYTGGLA